MKGSASVHSKSCGNIDQADKKGWAIGFTAPITTESKADSDWLRRTAKNSEHEFVKQVATLRTYKRKRSPSHTQQSSPKNGKPKGSTSFVPHAPDVHTKSLSPTSRVVPGTPEDIMPLNSAAPDSTPTDWSSIINGCGLPSLTTEVLSPSSPSSGLMCKKGKLLCCEGRMESLHPSKEKAKGDKSEQLLSKMNHKTPALETEVPDAVNGFERPPIKLLNGIEAEKMTYETYPTHAGPSSGKRIPFVKTSNLWKSLESMEIFRIIPQNPCFHQLETLVEWIREGTAIGLMVKFESLVRRVGNLRLSDSQSTLNEMWESLVSLEENGFDVRRIQSRIEQLLEIKNQEKQFKEHKTTLEEQILRSEYEESQLDKRNRSLDKTIMEVERQLASLHEERNSVYMQRMTIASETAKLQKDVQRAEEAYLSAEQLFNTVVSSPW